MTPDSTRTTAQRVLRWLASVGIAFLILGALGGYFALMYLWPAQTFFVTLGVFVVGWLAGRVHEAYFDA